MSDAIPNQNELSVLGDLRSANKARQAEWDADSQITLSFRGNELAGEVGEACNVIKKLERERLGINGSRASKAQLAEELADVVICADLIAMDVGVDLLNVAVPAKFNATSEKVGLRTRLAAREPVVANIPDNHIAAIWMAAMTAACNIVIKRQNDLNDDDGPMDVLNEQDEIIFAIKKWLEPDEMYLTELRQILPAAPPCGKVERLRDLIRRAVPIIEDDRDALKEGHSVNGELKVEDEADEVARDLISRADAWLSEARAALAKEA
ncbi:MAG TPA: MazG-like family protein [Xanthobacteraceae bacterium]|nr:MazG-like family protein [Xanthobacteraceae bacterium]